jgi:hypothetical protein
MLVRQLTLKRNVNVNAAYITEEKQIQEALTQLNIPYPKPVIVLVGGAGKIGFWDWFRMHKAVRIVASLAEETQSAVVDGGTQVGVMREIGRQRKRNKFCFPLIGVLFDSLLVREEPESILDPNHTHFFLIPGEKWGDESGWIARIATVIAGEERAITVLVNGGDVSETDVHYSLLENRPTFVMRGTGRLADKINAEINVLPIDISKEPDDIRELLKQSLI